LEVLIQTIPLSAQERGGARRRIGLRFCLLIRRFYFLRLRAPLAARVDWFDARQNLTDRNNGGTMKLAAWLLLKRALVKGPRACAFGRARLSVQRVTISRRMRAGVASMDAI